MREKEQSGTAERGKRAVLDIREWEMWDRRGERGSGDTRDGQERGVSGGVYQGRWRDRS
jgi:hypothetical protein